MKTYVIFFGASSFEHEISILSAITIKNVIKSNTKFVFIDQDRQMYQIPSSKMKSNTFSSKRYKKEKKVILSQGTISTKTIFNTYKEISFDTVINLAHGGDGEDGTLASLFYFYGIDFIGPNTKASVISIDKHLTKLYANSLGVKVLDYKIFNDKKDVKIDTYPVIIKPLNLGSSIGVSVVKTSDELQYAIDTAFEFDTQIIVEPFIDNIKEYNLAGARCDGEITYSIIEEPQKDSFLDFDQKYLDFARESKISQKDISDDIKNQLHDNFSRLYNTLFDGSLIRCDFFEVENEIYLNEINSIPGSMSNYLFDDFNAVINSLSSSVKNKENINIEYLYLNKIESKSSKLGQK